MNNPGQSGIGRLQRFWNALFVVLPPIYSARLYLVVVRLWMAPGRLYAFLTLRRVRFTYRFQLTTDTEPRAISGTPAEILEDFRRPSRTHEGLRC